MSTQLDIDDVAAEHPLAQRELNALREVERCAREYFRYYMQDEADSAEDCIGGEDQHAMAVALRSALRATA